MKYDKETFEEMIRDWKADHSPEYDNLVIEEITFDEDAQEWSAIVHDEKTVYSLTDDNTGNIIINYLATR